MGLFKRSRSRWAAAEVEPGEELRRAVSHVAVLPEDGGSAVAPLDPRAQLLRIVAEAVILQDRAAELLVSIRNREPLGEVAPHAGPLATRFFELRRQLPPARDAAMARQCETASVVLDHHGTLITFALDLLAAEWRSPAIGEQLERLEGLGAAGERLDSLYTDLTR